MQTSLRSPNSMVSLVAAFFLLFASASGATAAQPAAATDTDGHVVAVLGTQAWLVRGREKSALKAGTHFHNGDILVTSFKTSAKLLLGDGEVAMLLKPNSVLWLENTQRRDYAVSIKSGALLSTVRPPNGDPTHYTIQTNSATMGVRGATLYVREVPGKATFFCPCHGKIAVTSGNAEVDFTSKHHDNPKWISEGKAPLSHRMSPPPRKMDLGHSDAEIADLEKLLK